MFLKSSEFENIVSKAPLISIDLCIIKKDKILLGKRKNPPAKNYFFVPGGRILKNESKEKAFKRILKSELGIVISGEALNTVEEIGSYEHFYKENFLGNTNFGTHYIVLAYLVPFESFSKKSDDFIKSQHSEYIWHNTNDKTNENINIHYYTINYLNNHKLNNYCSKYA